MTSSSQKFYSSIDSIASQTPFIIVSPPLTDKSDDSAALHLLARKFNATGELAYLYIYPPQREAIRCLPSYASLLTPSETPSTIFAPLITEDLFEFYRKSEISPIIIYSGVNENIFNANFFVRYFITRPHGDLKPSSVQANYYIYQTDLLSQLIAPIHDLEQARSCNLYLPLDNFEFWSPLLDNNIREGICFYQLPNGPRINYDEFLDEACIEIKENDLHSHDFLKNLFCSSRYFLCNSAAETKLIYKSLMCECPVIITEASRSHDYDLLSKEFRGNGLTLQSDATSLEHALLTAKEARLILVERSEQAPLILKKLANDLKQHAKEFKANSIDHNLYFLRHILIDHPKSFKAHSNTDQIEISSIATGELPYVALPTSVIKEIARQVMYESQLWSVSYKINRLISSLKANIKKSLGL